MRASDGAAGDGVGPIDRKSPAANCGGMGIDPVTVRVGGAGERLAVVDVTAGQTPALGVDRGVLVALLEQHPASGVQ